MKRLTRPYSTAVAALVAAGRSPYDLTLPQWARVALALAEHSPQQRAELCTQLGIPRINRTAVLRDAEAYGVIKRCGRGWYRYVADTPAQHTPLTPGAPRTERAPPPVCTSLARVSPIIVASCSAHCVWYPLLW
jgi:hypothetical protein